MNSIEKVLLVVIVPKAKADWLKEEIAQELEELIVGCGGEVVETVFARIDKPSAAHLIGDGKVHEIADLCAFHKNDTVVFSQDLKGNQQRNLEKFFDVKVIDRTQLILDIFARHATSQEGKMQVELAQLEYLLPRLVGKGIALSRLGGGIGTLGPGETKLEVDRRRISQRIDKLKKELLGVSSSRTLKRKKRKEKGVPTISLVGYTNAGKSTLFNRLTDGSRVAKNQLFTTLDPLSRQVILPNRQKVVLSDTVGFMHDLPHHLIESFKATLEEVQEADLLLNVVDVSCANFRNLYKAVMEVLGELKVENKPMLTVLNKIDKMEDKSWLESLNCSFTDPLAVSAKTGENCDELLAAIERKLSSLFVRFSATIPISRMDLINLAHQEGQVFSIKYYNDKIFLEAALPKKFVGLFEKFKA